MKPLILWVGAFGVPILLHLANNHPETVFYAYEKDENALKHMMRERRHPHFFTDKTFWPNITFVEDLSQILPEIDLIILIIPNQFVRSAIIDMKWHLKEWVAFLNLSKWIDNTTLRTVSDTLSDELWDFHYEYAVLSGGMIASELIEWKMLGADIATQDESIGKQLETLFRSSTLDIRLTKEVKNTELYGALKNIFALYVGYLEGKWYGYSTIGYHIIRLYDEMKRLIIELWGTDHIDYGTYALGGDLVATCFWKSRNRYFGSLVGGGRTPAEALEILHSEKKHAEGYETLKWVVNLIGDRFQLYPELEKVKNIFR